MRILVTGCAGFIGSHVCERLLENNFKVTGIDNFDLFYARSIKENNLRELIKKPGFDFIEANITDRKTFGKVNVRPDIILHIAAKAGVRPSILDPQAYIDTNITGTLNLADYAVSAGIKKIVFASSSSVYGNSAVPPFKEDNITDRPISPYAFTKKAGEIILYNYFHLYQVNSICLRFFTVYGPRQRPDLAINKFVSAVMLNKSIEVYGDGSMARDYTFISDTVEGILSALKYIEEKQSVYEIINLGNNKPVTIKELIGIIELALNKKAEIIYKDEQAGDVKITCADIEKAKALLNYVPRVKLEEGIKLFYEWKQSI